MNNYITDADTRTCTITGTLLVIVCKIDTTQLISTVVVAGTGAIASFVASVCCRYVWNRIRRQDGKNE
jgi:hypothetical protein